MPEESISLLITLTNNSPVELGDFANSFCALSDEYKRFLSKNNPEAGNDDAKLYIKQLKLGSIIPQSR